MEIKFDRNKWFREEGFLNPFYVIHDNKDPIL